MEFLTANLLNTTTQLVVNSNTSTAGNLFITDTYKQFYTDGMNDDTMVASIQVVFAAATNISRIALRGTNAKEFSVFYNGTTASTFALTTADTTTSSWTTNTQSDLYLRFATISVSSITVNIKKTQTANLEKILGLLYVGDLYLALTQFPNSSGWKPSRMPKQIVHTLSDGGTRIHNVRNKWQLNVQLDYVPPTIKNSLETIFNLQSEFQFCPFGTSTSWDATFAECVWPGNFDFYEYSDNAAVSGYSGTVRLKETPT